MRKTFVIAGTLGLLSMAAAAEPPARGSSVRSAPTVAPPPDEAGTTTIQMSNGYIRYRTDDVDEADDDSADEGSAGGGTLSVMPSSTSEQAAEAAPSSRGAPMAAPAPAPVAASRVEEGPRCVREQASLAQRLLQIRGIYVDPATALVTLPQLEVPLSPIIVRSFMGTPTPSIGGTLLGTAISFDTETQQRTQQLAKCLLQ